MPTKLTPYIVFEFLIGDEGEKLVRLRNINPDPTATGDDADVVPARDQDHAIDIVLESRSAVERKGDFASCPARNWREITKDTKVEYRTTSKPRTAPTAAGDPAVLAEHLGA